MTPIDARQYAPATQRNREPILHFLRQWLPQPSKVLEVASGTGEHGLYFSENLTDLLWQPSDINPLAIASIEAWQAQQGNERFLSPLTFDMQSPDWWTHPALDGSDGRINVVVNINMIHISPWEAALGLFHGAQFLLTTQDLLYFYGPFKREGQHTSPSNQAFDQSLQSRDPSWGVRNLEEVIEVAEGFGFDLKTVESMPANNLSVLFVKK